MAVALPTTTRTAQAAAVEAAMRTTELALALVDTEATAVETALTAQAEAEVVGHTTPQHTAGLVVAA